MRRGKWYFENKSKSIQICSISNGHRFDWLFERIITCHVRNAIIVIFILIVIDFQRLSLVSGQPEGQPIEDFCSRNDTEANEKAQESSNLRNIIQRSHTGLDKKKQWEILIIQTSNINYKDGSSVFSRKRLKKNWAAINF